MSIEIRNLIGGELRGPMHGQWIESVNPATAEPIATMPSSGPDDMQAAVEAACQALPDWSRAPTAERSNCLHRLANRMEANLDALAMDESNDNGKPHQLARTVDIPRAIANLRFFANAVTNFSSESHCAPGFLNYTLRKPLGVVGCISPWNLPLYLFTWKIAPALATGNCVIGKPSEVTPLTAFRLSEMAMDVGMPPGVLGVIHGLGAEAGMALVEHPQVDAISFTGGTETGATIAAAAAPKFKKLSLELGGKNPNIVFADCDLEAAISTTLRSSFANQGQICLCGSRILVQASIYEQFRDQLVHRAKSLCVGDPMEEATQVGAIVSQSHLAKIAACVDLAREEGAVVLCGGEPVRGAGRCRKGWFYPPTVLEGLPNRCRTNQEEIFGPVVTLQPFQEEAEAIALANDVPYGLSATLWTKEIQRAHRVADQVDAGVIWVNCWLVRDLRTPFGGMKQSGVGREGGNEALRFFTQPKNVCIAYE